MSKEKPTYYAVIPATVRYDKNLTDGEKLLYGEITTLTDKHGFCWATNRYFAELYNMRVETISRRISKLNKLGYITIEILYKKNTKEIDKRIIKIVNGGIAENVNRGNDKIVVGGIAKKVKENKTSDNTTSLNKEKNYKKQKDVYFENKKLNELFIDFLKLRKKIKAVNSDRAIKMLINKLSDYDDNTKIAMIEQSIVSSWKDVYPLKNGTVKKIDEDEVYKYAKNINKL